MCFDPYVSFSDSWRITKKCSGWLGLGTWQHEGGSRSVQSDGQFSCQRKIAKTLLDYCRFNNEVHLSKGKTTIKANQTETVAFDGNYIGKSTLFLWSFLCVKEPQLLWNFWLLSSSREMRRLFGNFWEYYFWHNLFLLLFLVLGVKCSQGKNILFC